MTEPKVHDNGCIEFGPRSKACGGDPVRVTTMQGLWRLLGVWSTNHQGELTWFAEVVGPYFPTNQSRSDEKSRVFAVTELRHAGKAKPSDVAMRPETAAISQQAKQGRRRR